MDLEIIILSGERHVKSERKTDIIHYHLFVESDKKKMIQMNLKEPDGLQFVGLQRVTQD